MSFVFNPPYPFGAGYEKPVAYFTMEVAVHQPLKTYAGGLGFLSGSHLRSAYDLKQNLVGISILWKYGYYDQVRKQDQSMYVLFMEKIYGFLVPTDIRFTLTVSGHEVYVTAYYLPPELFGTAPLFFLSTDLPENDYLSRTISHKLYDANPETSIAAAILLGIGGVRLLEYLHWEPEVYHLNESHGLPLAFYLSRKYPNPEERKKHLVFTNHTPEEGGNKKTAVTLLDKFGFFASMPLAEVRKLSGEQGELLDHTLTMLRLSGMANAVSKLHQQTLKKMWGGTAGVCPVIPITNAQHSGYWADLKLYEALKNNQDGQLQKIKQHRKLRLFEEVAEQAGEIYSEKICTLVFARRFTGYKRADLLLNNRDRFHRLLSNPLRPVQIIWAGKPHPMDYSGIATFDKIVHLCKQYTNCSILVGYELKLSRMLKQGADIWLNVPRLSHEASGTSGITAAMNGSVNVSIADGWFPEFARDGINSFVIPSSGPFLPEHEEDEKDAESLYNLLEQTLLPLYYDHPDAWTSVMKNGMRDILPMFDSNRMAREYYEKLYLPNLTATGTGRISKKESA